MVTTFLILLATSIVVVCLMVMFPLIDLAFKKKAKPAPRPAQVATSQLSGRPWLALRNDFLRPEADFPPPLVSMPHPADHPLERITPLISRPLMPKGSEGATGTARR